MAFSGFTVGVGSMEAEGLVVPVEGEGGVEMGVVVDFSAIDVVLGVGGTVGVELDDGVTVSVVLDDGVSVVMGWKSGVRVSTDGVSVVMGWKSGVPVSVR